MESQTVHKEMTNCRLSAVSVYCYTYIHQLCKGCVICIVRLTYFAFKRYTGFLFELFTNEREAIAHCADFYVAGMGVVRQRRGGRCTPRFSK